MNPSYICTTYKLFVSRNSHKLRFVHLSWHCVFNWWGDLIKVQLKCIDFEILKKRLTLRGRWCLVQGERGGPYIFKANLLASVNFDRWLQQWWHVSLNSNNISYPARALRALGLLSSLRAESARAVTGRRCPHSGRGEDFLSHQPDFFYGNICNSGTESRKIVPKVGN